MSESIASVRDQLADRTARLVDRLRSLPASRLARAEAGKPSLADSSHALAQLLADLAFDLQGRVRRDVPRLDDLAVGDQVAVTMADLFAAVDVAHVFSSEVEAGVAQVQGAGKDSPEAVVALDVASIAVDELRRQM
ncbi:MAG: hypothetical protein NTZ03_12580 [Actinobacteria bacterium]|nr:hypothetical protein [Actinomycetota bacterium]